MAFDLQDGRNAPVTEAAAPSGRAPAGRVLCRLEDIEDGQGKGFTLGQGLEARELFVVRAGVRVFGYVNSCPHQGLPLDWQEDRFISLDSGLIMCMNHGAQFEIEDGFCVDGPCAGENLEPAPVVIDGEGRVLLIGE